MTFELTVLGSAGSHTGPGRPCSGYLLTAGGTTVLMDCGNGSTVNLQLVSSFEALDAIVVTHRHVDHCIDLVGMFYALRYHADGRRAVDLYAPPGVRDVVTSLLAEDSAQEFEEVFHAVDLHPGDAFQVGPMAFECFRSTHPVPTVSLRVTAGDRVLAYSSDSAGGPELLEAAARADTFLCEATWQGDGDGRPPAMHMTAREAGQHAAAADVGRLIITHVLGSLDPRTSLTEARTTFQGNISLAHALATFEI